MRMRRSPIPQIVVERQRHRHNIGDEEEKDADKRRPYTPSARESHLSCYFSEHFSSQFLRFEGPALRFSCFVACRWEKRLEEAVKKSIKEFCCVVR